MFDGKNYGGRLSIEYPKILGEIMDERAQIYLRSPYTRSLSLNLFYACLADKSGAARPVANFLNEIIDLLK